MDRRIILLIDDHQLVINGIKGFITRLILMDIDMHIMSATQKSKENIQMC